MTPESQGNRDNRCHTGSLAQGDLERPTTPESEHLEPKNSNDQNHDRIGSRASHNMGVSETRRCLFGVLFIIEGNPTILGLF